MTGVHDVTSIDKLKDFQFENSSLSPRLQLLNRRDSTSRSLGLYGDEDAAWRLMQD
jgi:hypothetical protein